MAHLLAPPSLDRTPSSHSRYVTAGVWCFERNFDGQESCPPVRLVVFDCDETLTLSTFMPRDNDFRTRIGWSSWPEYISTVNFESPWVNGSSRLQKLRDMLQELVDADGDRRTLAVLTRNEGGAVACLNLLMMAQLSDYFSAIWCMSLRPGRPCGVFRDTDGDWHTFTPPITEVDDHKADVLKDVCVRPEVWLPHLKGVSEGEEHSLQNLALENIVLVDDVRTNFQSPHHGGPKVLRYCKVARYDSEYRDMGLVLDMGGIGARNSEDCNTLVQFVKQPWAFKAVLSVQVTERPYAEADLRPPVSLVVFDFDETLSLYTFMPDDERCSTEIGFLGKTPDYKDYYVRYNFESPYLDGSRVEKLKRVLRDMAMERNLAVMTKNEAGAVAVLNLLMMAGLAEFFVVIWTLCSAEGKPSGVYCKDREHWHIFDLPVDAERENLNYKADMLANVVEKPVEWFPFLADGDGDDIMQLLTTLGPANIVLVDDERTEFQARDENHTAVLRCCKVARYDDEYRDQGLLVHMGGIGAKTDEDYTTLSQFVKKPWRYRVKEDRADVSFTMSATLSIDIPPDAGIQLERRCTADEISASPTRRGRDMRASSSEGLASLAAI